MEPSILVKRKSNSTRTDAGKYYKLKLSNLCSKTDTYPGCIVYRLHDGNSWNFEVVTQLPTESLIQALEKDELEIVEE